MNAVDVHYVKSLRQQPHGYSSAGDRGFPALPTFKIFSASSMDSAAATEGSEKALAPLTTKQPRTWQHTDMHTECSTETRPG